MPKGFQLLSAKFRGNTFPLVASTESDSTGNSITVVIGKNGVGKSTFLSSIAHSFAAPQLLRAITFPTTRHRHIEESRREFQLHYRIDNSVHSINGMGERLEENAFRLSSESPDFWFPKKVIVTSASPFDKFPLDEARNSLSHFQERSSTRGTYRYLGPRNRIGQLSSLAQITRVIESLIFATETETSQRLHQIFSFLGYASRVIAQYQVRGSHDRLVQVAESNPSNVERVFRNSDYLVSSLGRRRIENDSHLATRIIEAARLVTKLLKDRGGRNIAIELDFEAGAFRKGSIALYESLALLRQLKLTEMSDLRLVKQNGNHEISLKDASSGEQALVLTLLGIGSEITDGSLVCIDEPEISLHPEWQEKYIGLLTTVFEEFTGCHFVLATHSPQILARIGDINCSVLRIDTQEVLPAAQFFGKSSDYQLAVAFRSPGKRNEFISRIAVTVLSQISAGRLEDAVTTGYLDELKNIRPLLENDDPVSELIDAITTGIFNRD